MSKFDQLLADLQEMSEEHSTLAKSLPSDQDGQDDHIHDAAETGDEANENEEDNDSIEDEDEDNGEGDDDDRPLVKSMVIDGEEHELIDADVLLKSMADLGERLGMQETSVSEALIKSVQVQNQQLEMIKSLSQRVEALAGSGRGRKTVLSIAEKPEPNATLAKSEPAAMGREEIMAKAMSAMKSGALSGLDASRIEITLQNGGQLSPELLSKLS